MSDPKDVRKKSTVDFGRNPIEFDAASPIATLKLIGNLDPDLAKEFERKYRMKFEDFGADLILDLSECGTIHTVWIRSLVQLAATVKKARRRLRAVSTNPAHAASFKDQGVAANFPIVADLAAAKRDLSARIAAKLDVAFINPFLEGTVEVLKKQTGTVAKAGTPGARDVAAPLDGDISGIMPLRSESFNGSVILSFPEATYLKVIGRMLGEDHEAINADNRNGASEIANRVFGYAKTVLNEKGHSVQLARSSVVTGRSPAGLHLAVGPRIAIPFESDAGPFTVEIRIQSN